MSVCSVLPSQVVCPGHFVRALTSDKSCGTADCHLWLPACHSCRVPVATYCFSSKHCSHSLSLSLFSPFQSFSLSVSLSLSFSLSPPLFLFTFLPLLFQFICQSISVCLSLSLSVSVSLYVCLCVCVCLSDSLSLSPTHTPTLLCTHVNNHWQRPFSLWVYMCARLRSPSGPSPKVKFSAAVDKSS